MAMPLISASMPLIIDVSLVIHYYGIKAKLQWFLNHNNHLPYFRTYLSF